MDARDTHTRTADTRRKRRVLIAIAVVALATTVSGVWIGWRVGGATCSREFDDVVTAAAAFIATALCLRAALRDRGRMRLFWFLFSGACLCWTTAEVIWAVYDLVLRVPVPVPSWADLGYLTAIPVAVAALLCHPAMVRTGTRHLRSLLDSLTVAAALLFMSWTLVLEPLWHSTDLSTIGGLVALAYPFGDVVMIFFIVRAVRQMTGGNGLTLWLLLAGLLIMALADSAYAYMSTTNSYASPSPIDVGWIAAYLAIALAAFSSQPSRTAAHDIAVSESPTLASFLAPFIAALFALAVIGLELHLRHHLDIAASSSASMLLVLVLARQTLLAHELAAAVETEDAHRLRGLMNTALGRRPASAAARNRPHHRARRS